LSDKLRRIQQRRIRILNGRIVTEIRWKVRKRPDPVCTCEEFNNVRGKSLIIRSSIIRAIKERLISNRKHISVNNRDRP
jgi:hypothetical protein